MRKVLLVSANREHFPSPAFPLGAAYMAGALERKGFSARLFDAGSVKDPLKALREVLDSFKPDTIGLSLRNVDNVSYPSVRSYAPWYIELAEVVRAYGPKRLLVGGSAFSIFPDELYVSLGADVGITGEGEAETARFMEGGEKGIFKGNPVAPEDIALPDNLDEIFPQISEYKTIGIQTARGCPKKCIYCTYPLVEGRRLRPRPPEMVAEEISFLAKNFDKKDFYIVNSIFNADEEHMSRVLEAIASRDLEVSISCYIKPKVSHPSVFKLLKRAGCIAVDFGTDTGSESLLQSFRKDFNVDDIVHASEACGESGVEYCHSLLFGAPGENSDTISETFKLMDSLNAKAVVAMTGVRMYPGAEVTSIAQKQGHISPEQSLFEPCFYFSDMKPSSLVDEVTKRASERPSWFLPGRRDWSASISPFIMRLMRGKGPLWLRFKKKAQPS
jgi:radical SAM superfamily enzyme YgiQ (UPF0313 family)